MSTPFVGGKVLDAGALSALLDDNLVVASWLEVSRGLGLTLYVPQLVRTEVETIRPRATVFLELLERHPQITFAPIDTAAAASAKQLLDHTATWDAAAAIIVVTARARDWPVLSGDPGRLRRMDPDVAIETL